MFSPECGAPGLTFSRTLGERNRTGRLSNSPKFVKVIAVGLPPGVIGETLSKPAGSTGLQAELERRYPGISFTVDEIDGRGEVASEILKRIKRHVVDAESDVLVWQVGTTDALEQVDPQDFTSTLSEGLDWLRGRGVDVVLLDPQYFPDVAHEAEYEVYVESARKVARDEGVPLVGQYSAMQRWAHEPQRDLPRGSLVPAERAELCVAQMLAEGIAHQLALR